MKTADEIYDERFTEEDTQGYFIKPVHELTLQEEIIEALKEASQQRLSREKLRKTLNKFSKTDLTWMRQFHGKDCKVIDLMDYDKIIDELCSTPDKQDEEKGIKCNVCNGTGYLKPY